MENKKLEELREWTEKSLQDIFPGIKVKFELPKECVNAVIDGKEKKDE